MTNSLTMFKLETMIYASEDGTSRVFTLNSCSFFRVRLPFPPHPLLCRSETGQTKNSPAPFLLEEAR